MKKAAFVVVWVALVTAPAYGQGMGQGQGQPLPTLVVEVQNMYNTIKGYVLRAAEQFPEDKHTWAPTPQVRSWARLMGHIVDDQNGACFALAGLTERPARMETEDTPNSAANKMTKAQLQKALADGFALCDKAFAAVTAANMLERQGNRSKIGTLMFNTSHTNEHYGNIVTYMRLQGMVPPSSAPRGM
jgi:uncharacterized damage-inducible protein DinB